MSTRPPRGLAFLIEDRPVEAFEQLDAALRIVTLRHWVLLGLVMATLTAFVVFASLYKAPLKVEGRGILFARHRGEDPLPQVTAPAAGRLSEVLVKIGEDVVEDQILGMIDQRDLSDQIEQVKSDLQRLIRKDDELTRFDETEGASRIESLEELDKTLRHNLTRDHGRLVVHKQIVAAATSLRQRQLLSNIEALKDRAELDAVESGIGATEARLHELTYQQLNDRTTRRRERLERGLAIDEARTKLALQEGRRERDTKIKSPYAGKVIDLMITPHALVDKGAPVALLKPKSSGKAPMEAIVFVPAGMGKKVHVADAVEIAPDTVRRQEHGYVRGVVTAISEIPATEAAMKAELKHPTLVSSFVEQYKGQVLLSIHVELREMPDGTFGLEANKRANTLEWSSRSGSFEQVSPGTLCGASIVVDRRPLIMLALPWLRELAGMY